MARAVVAYVPATGGSHLFKHGDRLTRDAVEARKESSCQPGLYNKVVKRERLTSGPVLYDKIRARATHVSVYLLGAVREELIDVLIDCG